MSRLVVMLSTTYEGDIFEWVAEVPDSMDLEAERQIWQKWYKEEYCADLSCPKRVKYRNLLDQLLEHGCREIEMETFAI